jgi:hypothetical protein
MSALANILPIFPRREDAPAIDDGSSNVTVWLMVFYARQGGRGESLTVKNRMDRRFFQEIIGMPPGRVHPRLGLAISAGVP